MKGKNNDLGFRIVDIDAQLLKEFDGQKTPSESGASQLSQLASGGQVDTVGPGDVLQISVYEVGVSLFSGSSIRLGSDIPDASARGEAFSGVVVDRDGTISLPYIGRLHVAGRTPSEIQGMVEEGLRGKSQSPQAIVSVRENIVNTVYVSGEVKKPSRLPLSLARERLLDAIATAGGATGRSDDMVVRLTRGDRRAEARLSAIRAGSADDLTLLPGDRIEVVSQPLTYSVFGATTKVSQVPFEVDNLSLAEAIARVGGPNDATADASAIFLFRYPKGDKPLDEAPVIYRLNMMKPSSYFLAQRFAMNDKDVIYFANSASNPPTKFISILNQLFSPLLTARIITKNN